MAQSEKKAKGTKLNKTKLSGIEKHEDALEKQIHKCVMDFYNLHHAQIAASYNQYKESNTPKFYKRAYNSIDKEEFEKRIHSKPILVLTANMVELGTLHAWIYNYNQDGKTNRKEISVFKRGDITYYIFEWHAHTVINVPLGTIGSNTEKGSSIMIRKILQDFTPWLILSLGVGFGIDHLEQKLGDVFISKCIWAYDKNIKVTKDSWQLKKKTIYQIDSWLDNCFSQHRDFITYHEESFSVSYGNVLTGEMVVDNLEFKQAIIKDTGEKFIGGEMEGYGMFFECQQYGIPCAIIKGICDWGAGKNILSENPAKNEAMKDGLQAYSMENVLRACDILFHDAHAFDGKLQDYTKIVSSLFKENKLYRFFYQHTTLFYFLVALASASAVIYKQLSDVTYSTHILILTIILGGLICVFALFCVLLHKNKKYLGEVFTLLNRILDGHNLK